MHIVKNWTFSYTTCFTMKRNYKKENETKEEAWETTEILDLFLDWNDGDGTEAWEERRGEREEKKKKKT